MKCFAEFEKLKSQSPEYCEAFAEPHPPENEVELGRDEIREVFHQCCHPLKQFALDAGFSYSAVLAHFGGTKVSVHIHEAAQKLAVSMRCECRRQEILAELHFRAQERAAVPAPAAEVLPIWDGVANASLFARQIVELGFSAEQLHAGFLGGWS